MDRLLMLEAFAPEPEDRHEDEYPEEAGGGWIELDGDLRGTRRSVVLVSLDVEDGSD